MLTEETRIIVLTKEEADTAHDLITNYVRSIRRSPVGTSMADNEVLNEELDNLSNIADKMLGNEEARSSTITMDELRKEFDDYIVETTNFSSIELFGNDLESSIEEVDVQNIVTRLLDDLYTGIELLLRHQ